MKHSGESAQRSKCSHRSGSLAAVALLVAALAVFGPAHTPVYADAASDLQQKIDATNASIAALQKEIDQYQSALSEIGSQKASLQNEVNSLDLSRKKVGADISVTQNQITRTTLQLTQLGGSITLTQQQIEANRAAVAESLRIKEETDNMTLVELMLSSDGLADAWQEIDKLSTLDASLTTSVNELASAKQTLTQSYNTTQARQAELVSLKKQLASQKAVLDETRQEQATLLAQTKDKESNYQTLLAQKQKAQQQFQQQLTDYESSLKYTLDPNAIPKASSGVLSFPIDRAFMQKCQSQKSIYGNIYCITQYFGTTAFSQTGAYNGQGHNGVDFGVPVGTKIVAALSGTVMGTGNTDLQAGCYSYGKWVLVRHDNGLSSIYAHLSTIAVTTGERVATGEFLGYSGKTGYVTGPHLHFGLYVSSQVKIVKLGTVKTITNCGNVAMPVAPTEAYLNPMAYL